MKRCTALIFTIALLTAGTDSFAGQTTAIAHSGSPVLGANTSLRKFRTPFVSDATGKRIAFRGAVYDPLNPESLRAIFRLDAAGAADAVAWRGLSSVGGAAFRNFLQPAINNNGDVAWYGFLADGGSGIYRTLGGNPANLQTVLVTGAIAPISGYTFDEFDAPEISSSGAVVFWARAVSNASTPIEGIFSCAGGNGGCTSGGTAALSILAKSDDLISGGGGLRVCRLFPTLRVSAWGIAFRAETKSDCLSSGPGPETVLRKDFANVAGLRAIAAVGGATDSTSVYSRFRDNPTVEDHGIVAFRADTSDTESNEAIFRCDPSAGCPATSRPVRIVTKGDNGSGLTLRRFSSPQITNAGDVAFLSRSRGTDVAGTTVFIWRKATGDLELVATGFQLVGDPNLPGDTRFRRIGSLHASGAGDVVFRATASGSGLDWRSGIFLWQP
jgi:hypothetical protein